MTEKIWELVEYECQDEECLLIRNIPKDSKLGALSLDHRNIGEAIVEELNKQQAEHLERKLRILTAYLVSDGCALTDGQIRKIRKEMEEE